MARKEFHVYLLAYNLTRKLQCEASEQHDVLPIALSFKSTIQHLSYFVFIIAFAANEQRRLFYRQLITLIKIFAVVPPCFKVWRQLRSLYANLKNITSLNLPTWQIG